MRGVTLGIATCLTVFCLKVYAQGPSTPSSCDTLTLVQCEQFIVKELSNLKTDDIKSIITLSGLWSVKFRTAYQATVKNGASSSDIDQIENKIKDQLDPMEKVKSTVTEQMLKFYFPKLATWLAYLETAPIQGFAIFLTPSQTVSPFDEVIQANNRVQNKIHALLDPNLRTDWKEVYSDALKRSSPKIGKP
jgi:hypothetical protein